MAIRKADVTIAGISPLLMHRYPMEPIEAIEKKPAKEQAEIAAYRIPDDSGELYIPSVAIQRCLIAGATYLKGKGRATLQKPAAACVLTTPEYVGLGTDEYEIDSRPVVMPATRGRIVRHRPRLNEWGVTFGLEWDDALLSEKQMREVVDAAGQRCGLLEFRPAKKGPFGRFVVNKWEKSD